MAAITLGNVWSPLRRRHRKVQGDPPRNPSKWLSKRVRVDRVAIDLRGKFDPTSTLPWADMSFKRYLSLARWRDRRFIPCFTTQDPGSQNQAIGGVGYHSGIPKMDVDVFMSRVEAFFKYLDRKGEWDRVAGLQKENELAVASDTHRAGRTQEWYEHNEQCLLRLKRRFPGLTLYTGGITLEKMSHGWLQFNWWLAERGIQEGVVLDVHWNDRSLSSCEQEVIAFREAFPQARIACLENTARRRKEEYFRLALRLELEAYFDFFGWFGSEQWGLRPPFHDTSMLAVVGRREGQLRWNKKNATDTTRTAELQESIIEKPDGSNGSKPGGDN